MKNPNRFALSEAVFLYHFKTFNGDHSRIKSFGYDKADILPRDISDAAIVLGDALTYNGAEQTQAVESVTVDDLAVTYTVSGDSATNVGVYELIITANTNFTGTKTVLYAIKADLEKLIEDIKALTDAQTSPKMKRLLLKQTMPLLMLLLKSSQR